MMKPVSRPGTALSCVTEFEGSGQINPNPATAKDSDLLVELYLSPEKLKSLSGSEDLQQVTNLEMCVDTRQNTLGNFGSYLPNLVQLKMNNSLISSVRDLGITLSHLQVLSVVRCGLADLDGIYSLYSLKELYAAYNNISDLSHVSMLEHLEVLDLEGNNVEDLVQLQYLGLCGKLRALTLEGNPVCPYPHAGASQAPEYNYRSTVRKLIPTLQFLDDVPAEEEKPRCCNTTVEDWSLLKESINVNTASFNDCLELLEWSGGVVCDISRPGSAKRPGTSLCISSCPGTARPPSSSADSRPCSAGSDPDSLDHMTSDLTHGVGKVLFCGNPLQAVRARRQKIKAGLPTQQGCNSRPCTQLSSYDPEHTYDIKDTRSQDRSDVFAELRSWRKEHSKRLMTIERDRQPQVLRIMHSDDNDDDKDSTKECGEGGHSLSPVIDREDEHERKSFGHKDSESPDSAFHSSPEVSRLSSLSDHTMSPSPPPPRAVVPSTGKRIAEIRARRLRISNAGGGMLNPGGEILFSDPKALGRDTNLKALRPQAVEWQSAPPQIHLKPQRPSSSPVISPHSRPCPGNNLSIIEHKPVICSMSPGRPPPSRPHTADSSLQRLPILPERGNTHLN